MEGIKILIACNCFFILIRYSRIICHFIHCPNFSIQLIKMTNKYGEE